MAGARQALAGALVTICATTLLVAGPERSFAFGSNGGTEVSSGTAPADGTMLTHTDDIPANATQGSFTVQPEAGTDAHAFDEITGTLVDQFPNLGKLSKRGQATLACVFMSYLPYAGLPVDEPITIVHVQLQLMLLTVCLQMAQSIPPQAAARDGAHSAGARCGQLNPAVTIKITHSRAGYRGVVIGKIRTTRRPGLLVTCRRRGKGLVLSVRPRQRGQRLRQAGGPSLAIAYRNPTNKPVGIRTTFKVN